ncbi:hypothetical protein KAR91_08490 [Candidatus Pacearchaeota archaeon]|nr:hypothetical protein [Candidatus Pacearchaeota archaeon]
MSANTRAYSARELSFFGLSERTSICRRAKRSGFPSIFGVRFGKKTALYLYEGLPAGWRKQIDLQEAKAKLRENGVEVKAEGNFDRLTVENNALAYSAAPEFNRRILDKRISVLHESKCLTGQELKLWVKSWNAANPDKKTSVSTIMRDRKAVRDHGNNALLGKYGKRKGASKVSSEAFEKFKEFYLIGDGPSANVCWSKVVAACCSAKEIDSFPKVEAFTRLLKKEFSESLICFIRKGYKQWKQRHAGHADSDINSEFNVLKREISRLGS